MKLLVMHGTKVSRVFLKDLPCEGEKSTEAFAEWIRSEGEKRGITAEFVKPGEEEELCEALIHAGESYDGVILNVGILRYTSKPIWSAIRACTVPCVEVVPLRERLPIERSSFTGRACEASVSGMGLFGYSIAMDFLMKLIPSGRRAQKDAEE